MKKFLICTALVAAATLPSKAAVTSSLSFSATVVSCKTPGCVTVSLSWVNWTYPITYVEVDDKLGDYLFALTVPAPGKTTGSINPNPQTFSGLPSTTMSAITNSSAGVDPPRPPGDTFTPPADSCGSSDACFYLVGPDGQFTSEPFVADQPTPEPSVPSLAAGAVVILGLCALQRRRKRLA